VARGEKVLSADERRRLELVLADCENAGSLPELMGVALEAIDEHLGHPGAAWMLAIPQPERTAGTRAYAGVHHGFPDYVMEEYFERWAESDALASDRAIQLFQGQGFASIEAIYQSLDGPRRIFVDDFLIRTHGQSQLSMRVAPGGVTEGYITLMGDRELGDRELAWLASLHPHLERLLQRHLPQGSGSRWADALSTRERQVAELITLGFSNREIGQALRIEEDTVKKHVSSCLSKLELPSRSQLAVTWATGAKPIGPGPTPSG
jgi:DNA-binding CsgD family transcriptional regulator